MKNGLPTEKPVNGLQQGFGEFTERTLHNPKGDNMIRYSFRSGQFDLIADTYTVMRRHGKDLFHIRTKTAPDEDILILSPDCGIGTAKGEWTEDAVPQGMFQTEKLRFCFHTAAGDETTLTFHSDRIELKAELGSGHPAGDFKVGLARGSKCFANQVFSPGLPDFQLSRNHKFRPSEPLSLEPGLISPPAWSFSMRENCGKWFFAGIEPVLEEFNFWAFGTDPGSESQLQYHVAYQKMPECKTRFSVPALVFEFGMNDEYEALSAYTRSIVKSGRFTPVRRTFPDWHRGISVCGWSRQCELIKPLENCTQKCYEEYVSDIENAGLDFDILIIDDFWGPKHGIWQPDTAKWPDLRGFIDRQHAKGRHVLLWVSTMAEGRSDEEVLPSCQGGAYNLDSKRFQKTLKEDCRRLFSDAPGCFNADGVKFDFTSVLPDDYGNCTYRGVGFMYRLFELLHEAVLEVKPEAVVLCQSNNPYYTKVMTMIRLNDYTGLPENGLEEMSIRARAAMAACPGLVVDTDHLAYYNDYPFDYDFFRKIGEYGSQSWYLTKRIFADEKLMEILRENTEKYLIHPQKD